MRRTFIFAAMTICLVWWQQLVPATASARPEPALLEDNETSPYWTCNGNVCEQRDECGVSNCTTDSDCAGSTCPPGAELECLASGGAWHPDCTCDPPPCDPGGMATCAYEWGTWDPLTCMCSNPCNAGPPQLYSVESSSCTSTPENDCVSCTEAVFHCHLWATMVQYCQDGREWDRYQEDMGWWEEFRSEEQCWWYDPQCWEEGGGW